MTTHAPRSSTMLDPLPEQLLPGTPYEVPDDIATDPGDCLAYVCAICFGDDVLKLTNYFDVSRQTFWIWRKHGKGVPDTYRERVEELLQEKKEPYSHFRLPTNATIDHIMRPPRGPGVPVRQPTQNFELIDLLHRICASDEFGHRTLKTIISQMARPVSNPYVFYHWAWAKGGVPRSYVEAFLTALMQLRIYTLYGYVEGNKVQWEGWAKAKLSAPEGDDEDEAPISEYAEE